MGGPNILMEITRKGDCGLVLPHLESGMKRKRKARPRSGPAGILPKLQRSPVMVPERSWRNGSTGRPVESGARPGSGGRTEGKAMHLYRKELLLP